MSTTTYTLICGGDAAAHRAKYANTPEYKSYPEQVSFEMDACHSSMRADVMVTSSYPSGSKHTETISPDAARQLWKQWVSKGYSRWLTQNSSEDLTNP